MTKDSTCCQRSATSTGLPTDSSGGPTVDPTANVIALSAAANKRQDDLREMNNSRLDSEVAHLKEMAHLRAEFDKEIRALESNRLNAIRQVDVLAVNTAADRASAAIQALAAVTVTNADNLRNALNSTATTIAQQTANTVTAITERIAALEKSSYENKGKSGLADPMMVEMVQELKSLRESRSEGIGMIRVADPILTDMMTELKSLRESRSTVTGKSQGIQATWGTILSVVALIASLIAVGTFFFSYNNNSPNTIPINTSSVPPNNSGTSINQPQVIYVPYQSSSTPVPTTVK